VMKEPPWRDGLREGDGAAEQQGEHTGRAKYREIRMRASAAKVRALAVRSVIRNEKPRNPSGRPVPDLGKPLLKGLSSWSIVEVYNPRDDGESFRNSQGLTVRMAGIRCEYR